MADAYKKILGSSFFHRQSIHAGEDHLLVISGTYIERYRRVRYADVQCLVVRETERLTVTAAFLSVLAVIGGIFITLGIIFNNPGSWISGVIMLLIFTPILIYDLTMGRTCKTAMVTAVQQVPLKNVSRMRRYRRLRDHLQEKIYAEPGQTPPDPDAIRAEAEKMKAAPARKDPPPLPRGRSEPPPLPPTNPSPPVSQETGVIENR